MLVELPNGDWINREAVIAVRIMDDRPLGPRVLIDASGQNHPYLVRFDDADAARAWARDFTATCNNLAPRRG